MSRDPLEHAADPRNDLSRRSFLGALSAPIWASLGCNGANSRTQRPRNLLVLVADDLGRLDLGAYGNPSVTTPHIDRLAAAGCRFDQAFTPISLCKPSRSVLYTGRWPHANGATGFKDIAPDVPTLPELLADFGVATAQIGKLNVSPVERFPFEFLVQSNSAFQKGREPELFERDLRRFLQERGERPFCAFLNFKDPHRPFRWPEDSRAPAATRPQPSKSTHSCATRQRRAKSWPTTTIRSNASMTASVARWPYSKSSTSRATRW